MVLYCNPLPSLPMFTVWIAQLLMDFLLCTGRSQGATLPSKWASEQRAFPSMPGQGKLGECVEKIRSWHVIFFLRTLLEVEKHRDNDRNWDLSKRCSNLEG